MTRKPPKNWVQNRNQSRFKKFLRWQSNPIGALVRIIEVLYFGSPLFHLILSYGNPEEVRHLSKILDSELETRDYWFVKKARVFLPSRLVLLDTGHISAPDHASHSFLSGQLWRDIRKLQKANSSFVLNKYIPMPDAEYYYHFLIDDLASLLQSWIANPEYKVIYASKPPKYVDEILRLLQIDFTVANSPVGVINEMILPKKRIGYYKELRDNLNSRIPSMGGQESFCEKIYIGRRNLPRGNSEVDIMISTELEKYGFQEVIPDDLTIKQQIETFRHAKQIVALHGGALANTIFCESGTKITEIFNHSYRTYPFKKICEEIDLEYSSLEWSSDDESLQHLVRLISNG